MEGLGRNEYLKYHMRESSSEGKLVSSSPSKKAHIGNRMNHTRRPQRLNFHLEQRALAGTRSFPRAEGQHLHNSA